jgi:hypothetical protein
MDPEVEQRNSARYTDSRTKVAAFAVFTLAVSLLAFQVVL